MLSKRDLLKAGVAATASVFLPKQVTAVTYADYMLNMINLERRKAGVSEVTLGTNVAAQRHAENMVKFCHYGHWGVDGTLPYMRYSLAGGYQRNAENASGRSYCYIERRLISPPLGPPLMLLYDLMRGLMDSPGHKKTILDALHAKVNIGVAWDDYNFKIVQQFESDLVSMSTLPTIENGKLAMSGVLNHTEQLPITLPFFTVSYDPPPSLLAVGQVIRSYSYPSNESAGRPVAIISSLHPRSEDKTVELTISKCLDPSSAPSYSQPPQNAEESDLIFERSKASSCRSEKHMSSPIKPDVWDYTAGERSFSIEADIADVLRENGPGVYTVSMLAVTLGIVVWQHSIFHDVELPTGYSGK